MPVASKPACTSNDRPTAKAHDRTTRAVGAALPAWGLSSLAPSQAVSMAEQASLEGWCKCSSADAHGETACPWHSSSPTSSENHGTSVIVTLDSMTDGNYRR